MELASWTIPRLRQGLTRAAGRYTEAERVTLEIELATREEVPRNPELSGLAEAVGSWSHDELVAAYIEPPGSYDWRQEWAIEQELARRAVSPGGAETPPTLPGSLAAGWTAVSRYGPTFLGRSFLLGLGLVGVFVGMGVGIGVGGGGSLTNSLVVPLGFVTLGAMIVLGSYGMVRDGLSVVRLLPPARRKGDRPQRQSTWLIWGFMWLSLLTCGGVLAAISAWLLIPGSVLCGLALGGAVVGQLLVVERRLTPLAALVALAGMLRQQPLRVLWIATGWTVVWAALGVLPALIPICGGCFALLFLWILIPATAAGWAHVYAGLSGEFPPLAAPALRWSFPGHPLPRWLLPLASALLGITLWAFSGGFVMVIELSQSFTLSHAGLHGWAPLAAFGSVAAAPAIMTILLLVRARRIAGGIVLTEAGVQLDVTDRYPGRALGWESVSGFRLSEAGVRLILRRRPWTAWFGPLISVHELEAHELVAQLEVWGVRRDGA